MKTSKNMLKFEIPMFYTLVFYIEGNPKQLDQQLRLIMKKYGFIRRNKEGRPLTECESGMAMFLKKTLSLPSKREISQKQQ